MSQLVSSFDAFKEYGPGSASVGPLTVDVQSDLELNPQDDAALASLVSQRPEVGVFVSKPWLSGFFLQPPPATEPALVLLREGRTLRAVAPIAIRPTRSHVRVALLGGGMGSDRVDLLAARGFEATAADTFLLWLAETFGPRRFLLELRDVPASSPLWGAIHRAAAERTLRLVLQPREVYTHPYLPLGSSEPADLDEAPSTARLRSVDKHRRRLERRCRLRIEVLDDLDGISEAFSTLARLLHARRTSRGETSVLDQPRMVRHHQHILPLLLHRGHLRMIQLTADDRIIAVFYGVACGKWWGYYLAGYDAEWAGRIHLGQITLAAAIEQATLEGATEFDFLKGAERVKYNWPVRERASLDADVFSDGTAVQFARARRASRDAAVALTKSARDLFCA